ncbi:MAG: RNA polymerase sigma factor [Anaerolineae bacterium]
MNKVEQDTLFESLFSSYRQPIYSYLYRLVGNLDPAEELLQDVFVNAYRALPRLADDANHKAWLYRIATNAARDFFRRQRLRRWLPLHDEEETDEKSNTAEYTEQGEDINREMSIEVQEALLKLPLTYREPLLLYSVHEMSTAEIARVLGIGNSAVKMRLMRAREQFKRVYDGA